MIIHLNSPNCEKSPSQVQYTLMIIHFDEEQYPLTFREEDTKMLSNALKNRNSVELIGMKRVGISNFLRYFIYRADVVPTFISNTDKHLFIPVDLNDLIEIDMLAFWSLTLKRIVDIINRNPDLEPFRDQVNETFVRSIQLRDLFYTVDAVRESLQLISSHTFYPTLFFIRFDRLLDAATPELLQNLKGIIDATGQKLAYVFTSHREVHDLKPSAFPKTGTAAFYQQMYLKPAKKEDIKIIFETYVKKYGLEVPEKVQEEILEASGGHVQYVQLALLILKERIEKNHLTPDALEKFVSTIADEERMTLQSEELFAELSEDERKPVLEAVDQCFKYSDEVKNRLPYLWNTGYINHKDCVFSSFFHHYIRQKDQYTTKATENNTFTRKEQLLFEILEQNKGQICEREDIVSYVWPECNEIGVSDWAVDRLVARLRSKLKQQGSENKIKTVKTRGFMLVG